MVTTIFFMLLQISNICLWLSFLVIFFTPAAFSHMPNQDLHDALSPVRNLYTITDNYLINFEGKVFQKLPFKSIYHEKLAYKLKHPSWADCIYDAFETHILQTLNTEERKSFQLALVQVCQLLGGCRSRSEKTLSMALIEEGFPFKIWVDTNPQAWQAFMHQLHRQEEQKIPDFTDLPMKVVIITTSANGGSSSVAEAIKGCLDRFPGLYHAVIFDYETVASIADPIKIATGKYTVDNIFRLLQEQTAVDELLEEKDRICEIVGKYIPHHTAELLKMRMQELNPHLIISTRSYYSDDFNLLCLNIPFRMLNCDHEICPFHCNLIGKIDSTIARFWLPSSSPRFFKPLFYQKQQADLYQRSDGWETLIHKISQITHNSNIDVRGIFEVIGFPVRLDFEPVQDAAVLNSLEKKWDLQVGEKGILVAMGANGVGILEEIFHLLKNAPAHEIPIKYFFVCGKNEALREKLLQVAQGDLQQTALRRCEILGYLGAKEKSELMNICSLMISKPGGSTQAEVSKMQLPMLIMHLQTICEEGNKEKLLEANLAYEYDPQEAITTQIERVLREIENKEILVEDPDWKAHILDKLEEIKTLSYFL